MAEKLKVWTPEKVAGYAGCAIQTIYRQINEDNGPFPGAFRIGKKWVIPHDEVIDYFSGIDPQEVGLESSAK